MSKELKYQKNASPNRKYQKRNRSYKKKNQIQFLELKSTITKMKNITRQTQQQQKDSSIAMIQFEDQNEKKSQNKQSMRPVGKKQFIKIHINPSPGRGGQKGRSRKKSQHFLRVKALDKLEIQRDFLNLIKDI